MDDLTQYEIDLLNSEQPIFKTYIQIDKTDVDVVVALNYNLDLDEVRFKELSEKLIFEKKETQTWGEYGKLEREHYQRVRATLRKKGVTLIILRSYT